MDDEGTTMTRRAIGWLILFACATGFAVWSIRDGEQAAPAAAPADGADPTKAGPELRESAATPGEARVPVAAEKREAAAKPMKGVGVRVRGQVVDESGQRIAAIQVELRREIPGSEHEGRTLSWSDHTLSQDNGSFEFDDLIPPGAYDVRVFGGAKLVSPAKLEVASGTPELVFTVVLSGTLRSIRGRVVDESGAAASDVSITAFREDGVDRATIADDGRFAILGENRSKPVTLQVATLGYEPLPPIENVAWGTEDLEIRLTLAGAVEVEVVDASTGAPIEDYALRCVPDIAKRGGGLISTESGKTRLGGHHERGRATVGRVSAGPNALIVFPADRNHAPSDVILFDKPERVTPLVRVEIHRRQDFSVVVVTPDGTPVEGSAVELLCPQPQDPITEPAGFETHAAGLDDFLASSSGYGIFLRWAEGTTDRAGRASLACAPPPRPATLRVRGEDHAPVLLHGVTRGTSTTPLRVVVTPGARLRIVVQVSGGQEPGSFAGTAIRLVEDREGGVRFGGYDDAHRLDQDGTLELQGLPAGMWRVFLEPRQRLGDGFTWRQSRNPIAKVDLIAGQRTELEIDASRLRPAVLRGRVTLDGRPFANGELYLGFADTEGGGLFARTDANGAWERTGVEAGTYSLELRGGGAAARIGATRAIAPGETASWNVDVVLPALTLRIETAAGEPAAGWHLEIGVGGPLGSLYGTTDRHGRITWPFAPAGTHDARAYPPDWPERRKAIPRAEWPSHASRLDPIEVPARGGSLEFVRRLPR